MGGGGGGAVEVVENWLNALQIKSRICLVVLYNINFTTGADHQD